MDPEQILEALARLYAGCGSYRDRGRVVTRFVRHDGGPPRTVEKPFLTAFVRPDRFRFEYSDEYGRHIVWADGGAALTWWDVSPGVKQAESLAMALAGATGVSGGSAHTVPALLMPAQVSGLRLTDLAGLASLGDEPLGVVTCYRLGGRFPPRPADPAVEERERAESLRVTGRPPERAVESPLTLWIDRGTFLLRRIEESTQFETFRTETITTYEPATDVRISEDELRFGPPERTAD